MVGTPHTGVSPDSDSACIESATTDTSTGNGRCMWQWEVFPSVEVWTAAPADLLQELSPPRVPPIYLIAAEQAVLDLLHNILSSRQLTAQAVAVSHGFILQCNSCKECTLVSSMRKR